MVAFPKVESVGFALQRLDCLAGVVRPGLREPRYGQLASRPPSDPRTTPDSRLGRCVFAISVALLGHYLAFFMQMRPALYVGAGPKRCAGAKK